MGKSDPIRCRTIIPSYFCVCFSKVVAHSSFFCAFGSPFSPLSLRCPCVFLLLSSSRFVLVSGYGAVFTNIGIEELSVQRALVRTHSGQILRAERSSMPIRTPKLSAHQIPIRTHFGQILRAERSSNAYPKATGISLPRSARSFVLTTSAYLGRLRGVLPPGAFPYWCRSLFRWQARCSFHGWYESSSVDSAAARRALPGAHSLQAPQVRERFDDIGLFWVLAVEVVCKVSFQLLGPLFSQYVVLSEYFMYASTASASGMARRVDARRR